MESFSKLDSFENHTPPVRDKTGRNEPKTSRVIWATGVKNWGPSFFFQGQIWFFLTLLYIRHWNEPTISKAIGPFVLTFCGPSLDFEGNWPEGPSYFNPRLNLTLVVYEFQMDVPKYCKRRNFCEKIFSQNKRFGSCARIDNFALFASIICNSIAKKVIFDLRFHVKPHKNFFLYRN